MAKPHGGTYLACEENFDDFFGSSNKELELNESEKRLELV